MFTSVALAGAASACNLLIGNEDRVLRDDDAGLPGSRKDGGNDDVLVPGEGGGFDALGPCPSDRPDLLQNDMNNCGACGVSCGGGACIMGKCQPALVRETKQPDQVAVVGGALYFTHNEAPAGGVSWCEADNCAKPTLFFNQSTGAHGLAVDAQGVAVASPSANLVYAYPLRYAGTGQLLLSNLAQPTAVAVDATNVYFTTAAGHLYRCARSGCAGGAVLVGKGTAPGGAVAVGDVFAVWGSLRTSPGAPSTEGFLQQVAKSAVDGGVKTASFGRNPRTFVMNGSKLYWTATDGPTGYQGEVTYRPSALEDTEFLCKTMLGDPWGVAIDDTHVYFTVPNAGEVRRFPVGACNSGQAAETIATGQGHPRGLALDNQFVYWANFDGAIMRLRK